MFYSLPYHELFSTLKYADVIKILGDIKNILKNYNNDATKDKQ